MKKILIIEPEKELAISMREFLSEQDYRVDLSVDFQAAVLRLEMDAYDCLVIDIDMEGGNGLSTVRKIIARHLTSGIIIISGQMPAEDRIPGLSTGGFLKKPFVLAELGRRIIAITGEENTGPKEISAQDIRVFPGSFEVFVRDQPIDLAQKEFELLVFFLLNRNRVLTKEMIAQHLWTEHANTPGSSSSVYTHIKNLRHKIKEKGAKDPIRTLYGMGYKFQER